MKFILFLLAASALAQDVHNGPLDVRGAFTVGPSGSADFSGTGFLRFKAGTGAPSGAACSAAGHVGRIYSRLDAVAANASLYHCSQTAAGVYSWELIGGGGGGGAVSSVHGRTGAVVADAGDYAAFYAPLVGGFVPLANIPATLTGKNAATATALAANGTNCPAGQAPLGVDASGNAESCFTPGGSAYSAGTGILFGAPVSGVVPINIDTADVPRQGQTNVFTGVNDFSAGSLIQPRGAGVPGAGACTAGTLGASYIDNASGGVAYDCLRTGASAYTWTARGGGGGGSAPNRATAGQGYEMLPMPHQTFTNGQDAFTNNLSAPFYTQFNLALGITPGRMRVHLTGGTASASNGTAFAIYDAACNKIADATSVIFNGAIGVQEVTFASAPALTAGVYHLGYATQVAGQTWMQFNPGAAWLGLVNPASGLRNFTGSNAATGTGTGLTMPASCGTRTTTIQYPISAVLMP